MISFLEEVMHDPELLTQERKAAANIIRYRLHGPSSASASGSCAARRPPPAPSVPALLEARPLPAAPSPPV